MIDSISHGTPPEEIELKVTHRRDTRAVDWVRLKISCFMGSRRKQNVTKPDTKTQLSHAGPDVVRGTGQIPDGERLCQDNLEYRSLGILPHCSRCLLSLWLYHVIFPPGR